MKFFTAVAMFAALATPSHAQTAPTESDQRRACAGDAMRLCVRFIRDRPQMRSCMIANYNQLGAACRAVFDASARANGMAVVSPR